MKIFAYCALDFAESMRGVAGVEPITCPPATAATFDPRWMEGHDLLLFDLHGLPGADYWYAESPGPGGMVERVTALRADQVLKANLAGAIVFALSCYLGDEESPMRAAFLEAGASVVIAGSGENLAGKRKMAGAGLLAFFFRLVLEGGATPSLALATAKESMRLLASNARTRRDALAFQSYMREGVIV